MCLNIKKVAAYNQCQILYVVLKVVSKKHSPEVHDFLHFDGNQPIIL